MLVPKFSSIGPVATSGRALICRIRKIKNNNKECKLINVKLKTCWSRADREIPLITNLTSIDRLVLCPDLSYKRVCSAPWRISKTISVNQEGYTSACQFTTANKLRIFLLFSNHLSYFQRLRPPAPPNRSCLILLLCHTFQNLSKFFVAAWIELMKLQLCELLVF